MADKAYITPKILKWARESARMSLETAASKVPIDPEKLTEWEDGSSHPTIRQAEILAKAYRRPFALFFLPEIPRDIMPLQDFRRDISKPLSTASVFIIREIQQKQSWISDVNKENNNNLLEFVGKFSLSSDPRDVANDILKTLQIDPWNYLTDSPIKEWIDRAENNGILISRTSFIHTRLLLDSEEIQGFALADRYAPFIFINSDDWNAPQLFTLVHELAHIWIAKSGISNEIQPNLDAESNYNPIELFCNEVAANALMPAKMVAVMLDDGIFNSGSAVFKACKRLGVSSFALLFRALKLQLINQNQYNVLKSQADIEFKAFLIREEEKKNRQKLQEGGPNPYLLRLNKNSRFFTQIILDSFRGGNIEPTLASSLLSTTIYNFAKLEAIIYR